MSGYQVMPALSPEEYENLKNSIAEHGVQVPIEVDEQGNILDGNHRVRACRELGIKDWPSIVRVGLSEEEKRAHAWRLNMQRRHLTKEQREEQWVKMRADGMTYQAIADASGVSHEQVRQSVFNNLKTECQVVTGKDGKHYPPKKKRNGKPRKPMQRPSVIAKSQREERMAVAALAQMDTETLPDKLIDAKRAARLSREDQAHERAKDAPAEVFAGSVTLLQGDFRERGQEVADNSVDLIFTDPPYPREFLPLWSDLSTFAARVLKPDGMLATYTGALDLPEVIMRLSESLQYWWCGAIVLNGHHSRVHPRQIVQGVKPLLFFVKFGGKPDVWIEDTYHSEGEQKDAHDWQQSIGAAIYYIDKLTPPGGLVVDPFLGGGTTGAAAKSLGRQFIGIEKDAVAFMTAQGRIARE
ncbi:MAG: DNA methyltransferase [Pseudomonadota bacterium]